MRQGFASHDEGLNMAAGSPRSRPRRLAATLTNQDEIEIEHLFDRARVLVRLESGLSDDADARESFLFAVNQILRFCPNVAVSFAPGNPGLLEVCNTLSAMIHGVGHVVTFVDLNILDRFDAIANIGVDVQGVRPWTTINSNGWLVRIASSESGVARLPWEPGHPNPIAALAAACLGVGQVFLRLIGYPHRPKVAEEISLYDYRSGRIGSLNLGPELPVTLPQLDALIVGSGAVANGWAYAVKRLPVSGRLTAVDRESFEVGNIGPYVASGREWIGHAKVQMIQNYLAPAIQVIPRPEEWELFKIRLQHGAELPPLVINGLDNVETRHSVQRLWPDVLIDMASGGPTAQVIAKRKQSQGICLLRALTVPTGELGYAERLSRALGLAPDRILNDATSPILQADVEAAPAGLRFELERARLNQELICGRITAYNLGRPDDQAEFAPAAPFIAGLAGAVGAAETLRALLGDRSDRTLHFQYDARSNMARSLRMVCSPDCECQWGAAALLRTVS